MFMASGRPRSIWFSVNDQCVWRVGDKARIHCREIFIDWIRVVSTSKKQSVIKSQ